MRLIKTIIFFALLGYSVLFCVQNFQRVSISVPFLTEIVSIPLFLVIIICVIFGMVIGSVIYTSRNARKYLSEGSVKSENRNLKKKLDVYEAESKINENIAQSLQNRITED